MKSMSYYLIILFLVMLFILRLVAVITFSLGVEFMIKPINVKYEIALLFVMLFCIILISRNKILGTIILTISSCAYYGPSVLQSFNILNSMDINTFTDFIINILAIMVPLISFFIILLAKKQEKKPVDKKTDFFYKNEAYDRKFDDRADKNNYRTL